jgi:hypothetical protein
MRPMTLYDRAQLYNSHYAPPLTFHDNKLYGMWWISGSRQATGKDFYGAYHKNYLDRISTLFPDASRVLHLFAGAMPADPGYVRVGLDNLGNNPPDIVGNAEQLASFLPFHPDLIYADPPYSADDSEHYKIGMVNRARVVTECATVLQPGGFLVWLDQALPVFSNDAIRLVGLIGYIRSTGNRFRCVTIFQKP